MTNTEIKFEQSIERALKTALLDYPETESTILRLKDLLLIKGKEYRRNSDPYHNFNEGAKLLSVRPMMVLNFFRLKHIISIDDLIQDFEAGRAVSLEAVNEKSDDILVYTLIELAHMESEGTPAFGIYNKFVTTLLNKLEFLKLLNA